MIFDYMNQRNPGKPVPDKSPEPPKPATEYTSNLNVGYRDSASERVEEPLNTWWLPRTLRFIADCLETLDE